MRQFGEEVSARGRGGCGLKVGGRSWKGGKGREEVRNLRWRSIFFFFKALGAKGGETQALVSPFT